MALCFRRKKNGKGKKKGKPCICWRCQSPASLEPPEHHQQLFQLLKPLTIKSCFSQDISVSENLPLAHKGVIHQRCSSVQTALEKYRLTQGCSPVLLTQSKKNTSTASRGAAVGRRQQPTGTLLHLWVPTKVLRAGHVQLVKPGIAQPGAGQVTQHTGSHR